MSVAHVFIDEYGTPELDITKPGVTPYFIYTGVVIEEHELLKAKVVHEHIVKTYFGNTHMKSRNIANDEKGHAKRMKILAELSNFNHYTIALLVDKSKLNTKGFEYKKSFIKFFNNLLSKQFVNKFSEYHLYLDKVGRPEFQLSLEEYMKNNGHARTLFSNNTFELSDDITEEPLIQIADFYAGCVGKYYCGIFNKNQADAIHNIIKSYLFIDWFPLEFTNYFGAVAFNENRFDKRIVEIAIKTANDYLSQQDDEVGCEIVKLLLQETYINPYKHISSGEIKRKIKAKGINIGDPINEIAKLRSKGVFIVSPLGKKGYKFPSNEKEIAEFFDRLSSNVVPQLKRGHILHKILVEQSLGASNILGREEFSLLNTLINMTINFRNNK